MVTPFRSAPDQHAGVVPLVVRSGADRRGARPERRPATPEWFWLRVDRHAGEEACWPWLGPTTPRGYGIVWMFGGTHTAQRVAYRLEAGPIPTGLVIDHLCRNPPCCNPRHLEAVTPAENTRRSRKPRRATCARGHNKEGASWCPTCRRHYMREYMREWSRKRRGLKEGRF